MDRTLLYSAILFVAAFGSGLIVLARRWSDELLHWLLAFGAGVFLGIVFVHLLPETIPGERPALVGILILAGYLLLFFVEQLLLSRGNGGDAHGHAVIGMTALIGLCIHSLIDGLGLAMTAADQELGEILFFSILAHKIPAAIALTSLLILAKYSKKRIAMYMAIFAAMSPIGALVLAQLFIAAGHDTLLWMSGLVTGTFLYIATNDLLPEVFHGRHNRWLNLGILLLGILVTSWLGVTGGEHGHAH